MQIISNSISLSFEQLYTKYAAQLYGIIFDIIQSPEASHKILEDVFSNFNYTTADKKTAYIKLVCKTRELIKVYVKNNPSLFKYNSSSIINSTDICKEQLLRLVYSGRYTIADLKELTGLEDTTIKQKIIEAVKNKVKRTSVLV